MRSPCSLQEKSPLRLPLRNQSKLHEVPTSASPFQPVGAGLFLLLTLSGGEPNVQTKRVAERTMATVIVHTLQASADQEAPRPNN